MTNQDRRTQLNDTLARQMFLAKNDTRNTLDHAYDYMINLIENKDVEYLEAEEMTYLKFPRVNLSELQDRYEHQYHGG
jgi:hypothetical protein